MLAKIVPHFIGISGTPMTNHPLELYPVLNMILGDKGIESRREFSDRYSKIVSTRAGFQYKGTRRLPELHRRLLKTCMIRRLTEDVLPDLPDKTRQTIPVTLPDANMREYREMNVAFGDWYKEKFPDKKLRKHAMLVLTKLGYMKRAVAEWKLPFIYDWIDSFFDQSEEKLVVFGLHRRILDGIVQRYVSRGTKQNPFVVKIDGEIDMRTRQTAVDLFQTNKDTKLFVGQMRAAGVGITLTAAHHALFAECDFVPAVHAQAEDRLRRLTQKNHVLCTYLVANNTIEFHVCDILQQKQVTFQTVMDGGRQVDNFNMVQELLKRMHQENFFKGK
jgi:SWI/SNF-related matrix-associated actin-dependent regulator 1 of chromatin subfamily A